MSYDKHIFAFVLVDLNRLMNSIIYFGLRKEKSAQFNWAWLLIKLIQSDKKKRKPYIMFDNTSHFKVGNYYKLACYLDWYDSDEKVEFQNFHNIKFLILMQGYP